jgi:hypothetical protein
MNSRLEKDVPSVITSCLKPPSSPPFPELNHPFSFVDTYVPPPSFEIARMLGTRRVALLESTTGGLVAASLLAVPGASAFFIASAVVYTGRGAKRLLPQSVLQASMLMEREKNYLNKANCKPLLLCG